MTTTPTPDIDCLRFVERGLGCCGVYVHVRVSHAGRVRGRATHVMHDWIRLCVVAMLYV